jgi:hypothetical protein
MWAGVNMQVMRLMLVLLVSLTGCSVEPERSRVVPADPHANPTTTSPDLPLTKAPARIPTH